MEIKEITGKMMELINKPLPSEAVTQHPTKTYLSSIKAIYVLERLNEVFWIGAWTIKTDQIWEAIKWMVVVKVTFQIPTYWVYYECFWGNDNWWEASKNFDLWDAYKWATTDAITKICSYMGIWMDVFKWKQKWTWKKEPYKQNSAIAQEQAQKPWFNDPELTEFTKNTDYPDYKTALEVIEKKYKIWWPMKEKVELLYKLK